MSYFIKRVMVSIASVLVSNCSTLPNNSLDEERKTFENVITINEDDLKPSEQKKLSAVVYDISYIKLETNAESVIGSVDKVVMNSNFVVILDKTISNSIFTFDRHGKFIGKIYNYGKSPEDYQNIRDITIDFENQLCYVFNDAPSKVLIYNFQGIFRKVIPVSFKARSLGLKNAEQIALYLGNRYTKGEDKNLVVMDTSGKTLLKALPQQLQNKGIRYNPSNTFFKYKDTLSVAPVLSNRVYAIDKDKLKPRYFLDFGKHSVRDEDLQNRKSYKDFLTVVFEKKLYYASNTLETKDYLYFRVLGYDQEIYEVFYSKKTKKIISLKSNYQNDIPSGFINSLVYTTEGNNFVSVIIPSELSGSLDKLKGENIRWRKEQTEIKKILKVTKASDNPIIALWKMKEI